MNSKHKTRLGIVCTALFALSSTTGIKGCEHVTIYELRPESSLSEGCFEPCMCPIMMFGGVTGSFVLVERPKPEASLFREFTILLVQATLQRGNDFIPIRGSGRYSVGGEFASLQRLEMDLMLGDEPAQHFDSGLVDGGGGFPIIDARISVNGQFCQDTVIDLVAAPGGSGS